MNKPEDIPPDVWKTAAKARNSHTITDIARAIMAATLAERQRWAPATTYFGRYCQDEAESAENCVCGQQQHDDAKAFAEAVADVSAAHKFSEV